MKKTRKKHKVPGKYAHYAHAMCMSLKNWQKIPNYEKCNCGFGLFILFNVRPEAKLLDAKKLVWS
jgi:hypothetical protein